MSLSEIGAWESSFGTLCDDAISALQADEQLSLQLSGEASHFMRLNNGKVRQTGTVTDGSVALQLMHCDRTASATFPFTGDLDIDRAEALENLEYLRQELPQLPEDPYIVLPENTGSSREAFTGQLLAPEQVAEAILPFVQGIDFTGIYASGAVVRATGNSAGQRHWFATETFNLDYSAIAPSEKAVKSTLAGQVWNQEQFEEQIRRSRTQLEVMDRQSHLVNPGQYRTYFAPAATAELVGMLSWGAVSEASMRQGSSALAKLREGKSLSSKFTLVEDFRQGTVPRFNQLGEVTAEEVPIIVDGELKNTLVSTRTAKEYGVEGNAAGGGEGMRAPRVATGSLAQNDVLKAIDRGLYLSNLHYLNWSDRTGGRVTGMTRYACFWVEDGEIQAPIQDLIFDDSLYAFWGENLVDLTTVAEFVPEVGTY
ncbi:MAG: metallopeptidase TldD-related protein, partial [Cyanobacteria bacterium P01_G01_bin.4]